MFIIILSVSRMVLLVPNSFVCQQGYKRTLINTQDCDNETRFILFYEKGKCKIEVVTGYQIYFAAH